MGVFLRKSQKKEEERSLNCCQDDRSEIALGSLLEDSSQVMMEVVETLLTKEVILNSFED